MSAVERLAAALGGVEAEGVAGLVADALALDPHLAQDIEVGRRVREFGWVCLCLVSAGHCVNLADHDCPLGHDHTPEVMRTAAEAREAVRS